MLQAQHRYFVHAAFAWHYSLALLFGIAVHNIIIKAAWSHKTCGYVMRVLR